MTESATLLLREEEQVEPHSQSLRPKKDRSKLAQLSEEWQRVIFYAMTGLISLLLLLFLSEQINPPDSALRSQAMTRELSPWEGTWKGELTRYSLKGEELETLEVTREYSSSTANTQTGSFQIAAADGESRNEIWVFNVHDEEGLVAQRAQPDSTEKPFQGEMDGKNLLWRREVDGRTEMRRSFLLGNTMFVQEFVFSGDNPERGYVVTGTLSREGGLLL